MTNVLQSQAKPSSPEFRENRDHHLQTIEAVSYTHLTLPTRYRV